VIWFLIVAGLLSVAVLVTLLGPMIRQPRSAVEDEEPVAAVFRRQLAAIEEELTEGRLTPQQAEGSRTEISRRLLAAADRDQAVAKAPAGRRSEMSWRFGAAIAIAGLLPAAAMAVYYTVGAPAAIDRNSGADATGPNGTAELASAADKIKAHLQKAPDDLKGWTLLGRTLAALGRFGGASDAYGHAIALAPSDAGLHAEFGEVLVLEARGTVTPSAEAEFAKAPDDPRSRYYVAEVALQHGDAAAARQKLQALLASAPADAPWRQTVADRLAELSRKASIAAPAPASAATSGPTAQDITAARSMTPEQRQAMIRGMVERLAQRLEQHPDDKAGWERLARAYDVLGQPEKAQAARAHAAAAGAVATAVPTNPPGATAAAPSDAPGWIERARTLQGQGRGADALATLKQAIAAIPGNLPLLEAYLSALAGNLKDDQPTPEFVAVATQINALDAKQPDALWYLGRAAAQNGDRFRAASYWTRLIAELPPGDPQRAVVQHQLDALH
jgi:cytochrome c-type biogenesis protein CcmH